MRAPWEPCDCEVGKLWHRVVRAGPVAAVPCHLDGVRITFTTAAVIVGV